MAKDEEPDEDEVEAVEPRPAPVWGDEQVSSGQQSFVASLPLPVKLTLIGPAITYVSVRGVYRTVTRVVCRGDR